MADNIEGKITYRSYDNSFVITRNGLPYHVPNTDDYKELWELAREYANEFPDRVETETQQFQYNYPKDVRDARDRKMNEFQWRLDRHAREERLGLPFTDSIESLDAYMQALADITELEGFPWAGRQDAIPWPQLP